MFLCGMKKANYLQEQTQATQFVLMSALDRGLDSIAYGWCYVGVMGLLLVFFY
jgi:hypothetical protein